MRFVLRGVKVKHLWLDHWSNTQLPLVVRGNSSEADTTQGESSVISLDCEGVIHSISSCMLRSHFEQVTENYPGRSVFIVIITTFLASCHQIRRVQQTFDDCIYYADPAWSSLSNPCFSYLQQTSFQSRRLGWRFQPIHLPHNGQQAWPDWTQTDLVQQCWDFQSPSAGQNCDEVRKRCTTC